MKTIIYKILLFNFSLTTFTMLNSQTIIVRGQNNGALSENFLSSGQYYYKDVNNFLNDFIGTWEYIKGSEKFQITLVKSTKYHIIYNDVGLNFFEDRINIKYKKFQNGNLIYESPFFDEPSFISENGQKLEGSFVDYGRVTVPVNWPSFSNLGVLHQGGEYYRPTCIIEKMPNIPNEPQRIKFKLYLENFTGGIGDPYKNPLYNGQPTLSIPNMVVMKKVP